VITVEVKKKIGPGVIEINSTKIFKSEVFIHPGTTFKIDPGVSIIFKSKLVAMGTPELPIRFLPNNRKNQFGSVVISGPKTSGSVLSNVKIHGGNSGYHELVEYAGSLSVYNSNRITLNKVSVITNCESCNGINLYKVKDFMLKNIIVEKIKNTLLKIQLSSGEVNNSILNSTLQSGIESTFSEVNIKNSTIERFFNFGISEKKSKLKLENVLLKNGNIAIKTDNLNNKYKFKNKTIIKQYQDE
jgi:hypothetical protein